MHDEKGKKRYVLLAVDNHSKWTWSQVTKRQSSRATIKFLTELIDSEGVPRELKVDNATAFKSSELRNFVNNWKIKRSFSTPYVH